uniref:C2H2-type domain-containing protein n=1 Tax=Ciona savignyi TaxID=51511 RepID=H2YIP4_CIOSA
MSLNLSLFRCSVCKRAFFDSKRRDDHILASHGATSLKVTQTESSREHKHLHEQLSFETATDTNAVRNCEFTENSIKDTPPSTVKRLRLSSHGTDKKNVTNARHYTKRRLSCQFQYLVKHLDCLWPPTEQNVKLQSLKRFRRLRWLISKMPGHNYSHETHAHVKVVDVLNEEFDNRNQLDDHRVKNIQGKTGLSQLYIKAWFKWKRNLELRTGPKKVLQETFYTCQYPSKEKTKMIATVIGSTPNKVESWFLLSRVVSDILDPSEN